jgi:hypothetical protein
VVVVVVVVMMVMMMDGKNEANQAKRERVCDVCCDAVDRSPEHAVVVVMLA